MTPLLRLQMPVQISQELKLSLRRFDDVQSIVFVSKYDYSCYSIASFSLGVSTLETNCVKLAVIRFEDVQKNDSFCLCLYASNSSTC